MTDMESSGYATLAYITGGVSIQDKKGHQDSMFSDEAGRILQIVFYSALGGLVGVVGSVANVINFIVFVKQGLNDSVSVSMCAFAVSDLGYTLPMFWISICSNPLIQYSDTDFDSSEFYCLTGGVCEACFFRVTSLITAFITFERCVCIALPLKVKNIITPKRTRISIGMIYTIIFASNLPIFADLSLAPSFKASKNKTNVGLVYTIQNLEKVTNSFNAFVEFSSFLVVVICTITLVLKLLSKSKRRHKIIFASDVSDLISTRDMKVMKMVTVISIVFIAGHCPIIVNLLLEVCLSPDYAATGTYQNSYLTSWAVIDLTGGINSSVSILVYYNMNSKFRAYFRGFFCTGTQNPIKYRSSN